jgi:hypothetical protein
LKRWQAHVQSFQHNNKFISLSSLEQNKKDKADMYTKLNNTIAKAAVTVVDFKRSPVAMLKKLERGDADSGGSTLRTMGVVMLIIAVVLLIGAAVYTAAQFVAGEINSSSFPW